MTSRPPIDDGCSVPSGRRHEMGAKRSSKLLSLSDDLLILLLSSWLDGPSLGMFDTAVSTSERWLLLRCLHTMNTPVLDSRYFSHSSIRWLIARGVNMTDIKIQTHTRTMREITDETFLGANFPSLKSISLRYCTHMTLKGLSKLMARSLHLDTIDLTYWTITDEDVALLSPDFNRLRSLNLECCASSSSDSTIINLALQCSQLRSINISYCGMSDPYILLLAAKCPLLVTVNISNNMQVTDSSLSALSSSCRLLESIDIENNLKITDIGIATLAQCRNLRHLNVNHIGWISERALSLLNMTSIDIANNYCITDAICSELAKCRHLTHLNIASCSLITDTGVTVISKDCPSLSSLNISRCGVTDTSVKSLGIFSRNLLSIDLSYCHKITDKAITILAQGGVQLRSIVLTGCKYISDDGLYEVSKHCPSLRSIQLDRCHNVTDRGVTFIANCHQLQKLNLSICTSIYYRLTDRSILSIARGCPLLSHLDISCCKNNITDISITSIARSCRQLKYINLSYCHRVTDISLLDLACHCIWLEIVKVRKCYNISDSSVIALAVRCRQLATIDVYYCPCVTVATVLLLEGRGIEVNIK